MKPIVAASLLALALSACGGPSDEDVLTPDKVSASESAPELPDIQLSESPEPPPAPPPVEEPVLNELGNEVGENAAAPEVEGPIPAAFRDRWGRVPADCRPGDVVGSGLVIGPDSLASAESVGRLVEVTGNHPERLTAIFDYDGEQREEELVLAGSSNTLIRTADGQRYAYRRCRVASPTG